MSVICESYLHSIVQYFHIQGFLIKPSGQCQTPPTKCHVDCRKPFEMPQGASCLIFILFLLYSPQPSAGNQWGTLLSAYDHCNIGLSRPLQLKCRSERASCTQQWYRAECFICSTINYLYLGLNLHQICLLIDRNILQKLEFRIALFALLAITII